MTRSIALELVVIVGFVALSLVGGPLPAVALLGACVALLGGVVPAGVRARLPWTPLAVGAVVGIGGQVALGAAPVEALGSLLAVLQVHRRVARRGTDDDRVAVVLSGLMVVSAAGAGPSASFVAVATAYGLSLPLALLPARSSGGWGWVPLHVLLTAALFLVLPRPVRPPLEPAAARMTGFAPDVALGELDPLLDDPSVVFRARVAAPSQLARPTYWRGIALDGFDGTSWFSRTPPAPTTVASGVGVDVAIELVSAVDGVLFVPGRVVGLDLPGVTADTQGGWFVAPERRALTYTVTVVPEGAGDAWSTSEPHARWLELPAMDSRVFELARSIAGEGTDRDKAERLATWLQQETTYTREGRASSDQPVEDFLLRQRRGHCELVAAGLAVLGRAVDLPTRVVNGFVGSEIDPLTGDLVVRRHHAHSWTEVLLDGSWVVFDATPEVATPQAPSGWRPLVRAWMEGTQRWFEGDLMDFDRTAQRAAVVGAATMLEGWVPLPSPGDVPWVGLGLLSVALVTAGLLTRVAVRWVLRRVSSPIDELRRGPVARQHQRARDAITAAGVVLPPQLPPVEAAAALAGRVPDDVQQALLALAWLHYEVALAGADPRDHLPAAREHAALVVQGMRLHGTESP